MNREVYEKLRESESVINLFEGDYAKILVNAGGQRTPKLYIFAFDNDEGQPIVTEISEEAVLEKISEG